MTRLAQADAVELQGLISSKNERVSSYLRKCSEVWLVIVADWSTYLLKRGNRERQTKFKSELKKILYYDAESESVIEPVPALNYQRLSRSIRD